MSSPLRMLLTAVCLMLPRVASAEPGNSAPLLRTLESRLPFTVERETRRKLNPGWDRRIEGPRASFDLLSVDTELRGSFDSMKGLAAIRMHRATLGGRLCLGEAFGLGDGFGERVRPSLLLNLGIGRMEYVSAWTQRDHVSPTGDLSLEVEVALLRPLTLSFTSSSGILLGHRDDDAFAWATAGTLLRLRSPRRRRRATCAPAERSSWAQARH